MRVVISQPRYLPAVSYLQRLYNADLFVFLDNVQRQSRGVENRNKILVNGVVKWLTIPVKSSSREKIYNAKIDSHAWVEEHKNKILNAYRKHPFFNHLLLELYYKHVEKILHEKDYSYSDTIIHLVLNASKIFGFEPKVVKATELNVPAVDGVENLFNIAKAVNAKVYISGGNGRQYGVKEYFESRGIKVLFHDPKIEVYPQYGVKEFVPWLCFFDTLFNVGLENTREMIYREWELKEK